MNPFSDIVRVNESKNIIYPQLITVGSSAGQGKSLVIFTMAINYIKAGVNVILFSEMPQRYKSFDINSLKVNKNQLGRLFICNLFYEDTIQAFNQKIAHHLEFLIGSCVIIIDGPMFDLNNSFSYTKFKDENTRVVIFEKYNLKAKLAYLAKTEVNKYAKQQQISETLRSLAINFNTHVIFSNQHYNSPINNANNQIQIPTNNSMVYASDIYFSVRKSEKIFSITRLKDRTGHAGLETKCILEKNNLTLATIKK